MADYTTADPIREHESDQTPPSVTIYENRDLQGDYWTVNTGMEYVGSDWNDRISSFRIDSGSFEFYGAIRYGTEDWGPIRLGVGEYKWVADVGIRNDTISSWKAFYGAGTPAGGDGGGGNNGSPTEKAMDFVHTYTLVDPNDAGCGARGRTWFNNRHPSKTILVYYSVSPTESRQVDVVPKILNGDKYTFTGCGDVVITNAEFE